MNSVIQEIKKLESVKTFSKTDRIVNGVLNAISENLLHKKDPLPSVNYMINELSYARQTIVKAYNQLVHTGVVESKNRVGYFVASDNSEQTLKVALVLYAFDTFQEIFYEKFRNGLGDNVQLDIYFHHYNWEIFKSTLESLSGKYGMYVIASIPDSRTVDLLKILPTNRVLLVDRHVEATEDYSHIVQEFKHSSYKAFAALAEKIRKYDQFVFYFRKSSADPQDILDSFEKFLFDYKINGIVKESYKAGSLENGKVYFTINNLELFSMLKDAKTKGFELGKDVGIISHNDDIVKEIIFGGVTTFSTDFGEMGRQAADYVLSDKVEKIKKIIPTVLVDRNSL